MYYVIVNIWLSEKMCAYCEFVVCVCVRVCEFNYVCPYTHDIIDFRSFIDVNLLTTPIVGFGLNSNDLCDTLLAPSKDIVKGNLVTPFLSGVMNIASVSLIVLEDKTSTINYNQVDILRV